MVGTSVRVETMPAGAIRQQTVYKSLPIGL
jgi:hypothetical protein